MRYVRFLDQEKIQYGQLLDDNRILILDAAPYQQGQPTGETIQKESVQLLAPCEPTKIVAVGKNYHEHIQEFDQITPEDPVVFLKPLSAINDPDGIIELPPRSMSNRVDYEGELAVVIRKTARKVKAEDAADYILGYTILNDVTARDLQKKDGQWIRAKGMDGFSPFGPIISDEIDPDHVAIQTRLNGRVVQEGNSSQLIWKVANLIEFITAFMTLLPGDVLATGTPAGIGPMEPGDVVEVEIEGLGILKNNIR